MLLHHIAMIRRSALTSISLILILLIHFHLLAPLTHASCSWDGRSSKCGVTPSTETALEARQQATRSWLQATYPQSDYPGDLRSSGSRGALGPLVSAKQLPFHEGQAGLIASFSIYPLFFSSRCLIPPTPDAQVHLKRAPPIASLF